MKCGLEVTIPPVRSFGGTQLRVIHIYIYIYKLQVELTICYNYMWNHALSKKKDKQLATQSKMENKFKKEEEEAIT